jgi:hypothetical protein
MHPQQRARRVAVRAGPVGVAREQPRSAADRAQPLRAIGVRGATGRGGGELVGGAGSDRGDGRVQGAEDAIEGERRAALARLVRGRQRRVELLAEHRGVLGARDQL